MSEVGTDTPGRNGGNVRFDSGLNVVVVFLIVGILAFSGWFGYSVWRDRQKDQATQAPNRVIDALRAQVNASPGDVALRVRLGEALGAAGRYPEAIEQLNAALKVEPDHIGAHLDLGLVALLMDKDDEAESYLKKVVTLTEAGQYAGSDERREKALYQLGVLKLTQGENEAAAGYFKGALRIRKDASDTYLALAQALEGMGEIDGAIDSLNLALAFDPGYAEAHYNIGLLYQRNKDEVKASYHMVKAAEHAPDAELTQEALAAFGTAEEWLERAELSEGKDDLDRAIIEVQVARNLDAQSVAAVKMHARLLEEQGSTADALSAYLDGIKIAPDDQQIETAVSRIERDQPKDALRVYRRLLEAKPSDAELKKKVKQLEKSIKS